MKLIKITLCLLLVVNTFCRTLKRRKNKSGLSELKLVKEEEIKGYSNIAYNNYCKWNKNLFFCEDSHVYDQNFEDVGSVFVNIDLSKNAYIEDGKYVYGISFNHLEKYDLFYKEPKKTLFEVKYEASFNNCLALVDDLIYEISQEQKKFLIYKVSELESTKKEFLIIDIKYSEKYTYRLGAAKSKEGYLFFAKKMIKYIFLITMEKKSKF